MSSGVESRHAGRENVGPRVKVSVAGVAPGLLFKIHLRKDRTAMALSEFPTRHEMRDHIEKLETALNRIAQSLPGNEFKYESEGWEWARDIAAEAMQNGQMKGPSKPQGSE